MRYGGHEGEYGGYGKVILNLTVTGVSKFGDGTVSAPSISFSSEPATGYYFYGAGTIGFSLNGTLLYQIIGSGVLHHFGFWSSHPMFGVGYTTNAGGTVNQGSGSGKATAVTLSKVCGTITMDAASLAADTTVSFTLTNTAIGAADLLILNHTSGGTVGAYAMNAQVAAGSAVVNVRNLTAGALAEAVVIRFAVIKGVVS